MDVNPEQLCRFDALKRVVSDSLQGEENHKFGIMRVQVKVRFLRPWSKFGKGFV